MTSKLILPQEIKPRNSQWGYGGQLSTAPSTATISPNEVYEAWPMSAAKVGIGMLTGKIDPREVWQGLKSSALNPPQTLRGMTPEQAAEKGIEGALSFSPGNIGVMGGLLGGAKAIARPTGLSNAVEMASKGHNVEDIWQKTGWIKGKEGKWRFEIDDSMMNMKFQGKYAKGESTLGEFIDHPSLFKQYPELKDMTVSFDIIPEVGSAGGDFTKGRINIRASSKEKAKEVLTHEIQHAIQEKEGFARGGSPEMFTQPRDQAMARVNFLNSELSQLAKEMDKVRTSNPQRYEQLKAEYETAMNEKMNLWEETTKDPFGQYKNLHGEFEARDSASRLLWDKEKRGLIRPYSSEVEPQGGWILR